MPLSRPDITQAEIDAVAEVMRSGWITTGPKVAELEALYSEACGGHAVAVSSCTAGMHLAIEAQNMGKLRIAVPVWTFSATAEAVEMAGCTPVFKDVDQRTLQYNYNIESVWGFDYVIPVNIAGNRANFAGGRAACIDAAHSLPYKIDATTVFSFHANKPVTAGEGGMIVFLNAVMAAKAKVMRSHGIERDAWARSGGSPKQTVVERGFKYNMTDIQAAIAIEQFKRRHEMHCARAKIALAYTKALRGCMFPEANDETHSWHQFIIMVPNRKAYIAAMMEKGIQCGIHYKPLHRQPYWRDKYKLTDAMFPNASAADRHAVSLPIFSTMTPEQVAHVIKSSNEVLA